MVDTTVGFFLLVSGLLIADRLCRSHDDEAQDPATTSLDGPVCS